MPQTVFPAPGTENSLQLGSLFGGIDLGSSGSSNIQNLLLRTEELTNPIWERGVDLTTPFYSQYNGLTYYLNDSDILNREPVHVIRNNEGFTLTRFDVYNAADQYVFDKDLLRLDNVNIGIRNESEAFTLSTTSRNAYIRQTLAIERHQFYTLTFYAKRGSATNCQLAVFTEDMYPLVAPFSYYHLTNTSTFNRITVSFFNTSPSPTRTITVYLLYPFTPPGQPGTVFIYGPQLEKGQQATSYMSSTNFSIGQFGGEVRSARTQVITGGLNPYPFASNNLTSPSVAITGYDYFRYNGVSQYLYDLDLIPTTNPPVFRVNGDVARQYLFDEDILRTTRANIAAPRTLYYPYQPVAPFAANTFVKVSLQTGDTVTNTSYYVNSVTNYSVNITAEVIPTTGGAIVDAASFTLNQEKIVEINRNFTIQNAPGDAATNYYIATYFRPNFRAFKYNIEPSDARNNLLMAPAFNEGISFNVPKINDLYRVFKEIVAVAEGTNPLLQSLGAVGPWYSMAYGDIGIYQKVDYGAILNLPFLNDLRDIPINLDRTQGYIPNFRPYQQDVLGAFGSSVEHRYNLGSLGAIRTIPNLFDLTNSEIGRRSIGKLVENYFTALKDVSRNNLQVYQVRISPPLRQAYDETVRTATANIGNVQPSLPINDGYDQYQTFIDQYRTVRPFTPSMRLFLSFEPWLAGGSRQLTNTDKPDNEYFRTGDTNDRLLNKVDFFTTKQGQLLVSDPNIFTVDKFNRSIFLTNIPEDNFLYKLGRTETKFTFTPLLVNYPDVHGQITLLEKKSLVVRQPTDLRALSKLEGAGLKFPTTLREVVFGNRTFGQTTLQNLLRSVERPTALAQLRKYANEGALGPTLRVVGQNNITYNVAREYIFDTDFSGNRLYPLRANTNANVSTITVTVNKNMSLSSPSVYFDGYNHYVYSQVALFGSLLRFQSRGTVEMWLQPLRTLSPQIITSFFDGNTSPVGSDVTNLNPIDIFLNRDLQVCIGRIAMQSTNAAAMEMAPGSEITLVRTQSSISSEKLSHLAVVFDNNSVNIFIDGRRQFLIGTTSNYFYYPKSYGISIGYSAYNSYLAANAVPILYAPVITLGTTASNPALSPQQLADAGITTTGFYFYRAAEMSTTIQLYTIFNMADGKPWVRVFSSPFASTATINQVGQSIPWHGILLQQDNTTNRQWTYFATRQLFNTRSDTSTSTSGSVSGVRVFLGQAGGHGFYNTAQLPCNWGSSGSNLIAAGYDGSCGTYPNALRWGLSNGGVNYSMLGSATVETWLYWTHIGS